jgi:asparaginyl-tRNA synthetase
MEIGISQVAQFNQQEVTIKGWVYHKTEKGRLCFIIIRDGTGFLQAVAFKPEVGEEVFQRCEKLTQESSIIVTGRVREDKRAPSGYELTVKNLEIVQIAQNYPITPQEYGIQFLLDHRHLWLRSLRPFAILRIRNEVIKAIRHFFDERDFILIDAPIFTPSACEGTTNLFEVNYFEKKAFLTQSGQLYMEAAAMAFKKVYCFGPTFRAEKSKTRRHLTEFWMVEPEVAFAQLEEVIKLAEELVVYIIHQVLSKREKELEILGREKNSLKQITLPFPRLSYEEAIKIIQTAYDQEKDEEAKKDLAIKWGEDFGGRQQTVLAEYFNQPVIVHRYPAQCKAFYMKPDPENEKLVLCFDLYAPEGYGEIIGGSERISQWALLREKLKEHGLPAEHFNWYLELRQYGSVPHAGFGLGIERLVAWLCGVKHIRETIPFPRTIYRLAP